MGKFYTDQQRFNTVKEYRLSGKTVSEFAREKNISRETLRDWVNAYNNLSGNFINVSNFDNFDDILIKDDDVTVNILSDEQKYKRRFTRFDHSIVMIEFKGLKISTSLEQAEILLDRIYEHL